MKTASKTIEELKQFAAATPYGLQGLADATRLLLSYGVSAGDATRDVKMLAEIAGGSTEKLDRLALAFGQIASKGRLMGSEALQLTEAGFSPLQQLAEMTGQSMLTLADKMSKGQISFDQVRSALAAVTSEAGRFNGMLDRMSKTASGQWASLKEELAEVARSIGEQLLPTVREWIAYARDIIKRIGDWVRDNKKLGDRYRSACVGARSVHGRDVGRSRCARCCIDIHAYHVRRARCHR